MFDVAVSIFLSPAKAAPFVARGKAKRLFDLFSASILIFVFSPLFICHSDIAEVNSHAQPFFAV